MCKFMCQMWRDGVCVGVLGGGVGVCEWVGGGVGGGGGSPFMRACTICTHIHYMLTLMFCVCINTSLHDPRPPPLTPQTLLMRTLSGLLSLTLPLPPPPSSPLYR